MRRLAFSGGATRGLGFIGILRAVRDRFGIDWGLQPPAEVAGTSFGALIALMLVLGYSVDRLTAIAMSAPLREIMSFDPTRPLLEGAHRGGNDRAALQALVERILREGGQSTELRFGDLTRVHLSVPVTELTRGDLVVVSSKDPTYARVRVMDAVLASMSLPFLFDPCWLDLGHGPAWYADGGMRDHFPLDVLDPTAPADEKLGFRVWRPPHDPSGVWTWSSLFECVMFAMTRSFDEAQWAQIPSHRVLTVELHAPITSGPANVRALIQEAFAQARVDLVRIASGIPTSHSIGRVRSSPAELVGALVCIVHAATRSR